VVKITFNELPSAMKKKKFDDWFFNYAYNNWKFTPKSKNVLIGAGSIVAIGLVTALLLNNKK
jgi:hypothetical protein